jgi:hypothetical protein
VRVVGNEAVHPGSMDLKDDQATVNKLFMLVNLVIENRIGEPKKVKAMFGDLPAAKLKGIEDRDKPKS